MQVGIGADKSGYWVHLMEYIQNKGEWQAYLFTEEESLHKALEERQVDVLFLQEGLFRENIYDRPTVWIGGANRPNGIYQYQPVERIYEELTDYIRNQEGAAPVKKRSVYGVYSPLGRSGKTSYALAYAKKHSFFYIGMEEYGIKGKDSSNMEEVMYHIRNRKENLTEVLCAMAEEWNGIQMVPSPTFFSDIHLMEPEDYFWFLEQIRNAEKMPSVFVDFGTGTLDHMEVLEYFDKIYVPVLSGPVEEQKLTQFWELLREVNGDMDVKDKIIKIMVPKTPWDEEGFLEKVQYVDGLGF